MSCRSNVPSRCAPFSFTETATFPVAGRTVEGGQEAGLVDDVASLAELVESFA